MPQQTRMQPTHRSAAGLGLFVLPSTAQSVLLTVVPLAALRLLGTARAVTLIFIAAGLAAVVARLSIPLLVQLVRRRWVLSVGALLVIIGTLLLTSNDIGICLRFGAQQLCLRVHRDH